jgi:tRNA (mo5U34)-methyltransferase
MSQSPSTPDLASRVASVPFWWHSIDLGGVVTPGRKSPEVLQRELTNCRLPDLRGVEVLDIGAWDGFFSFSAERLGAKRVVALDHFVWSLDTGGMAEDGKRAERAGETGRTHLREDLWHPESLPGKRGFDLAHDVLRSSVQPVVADFMETDLSAVGTFDVVFFLGVLYHMKYPLRSLERLASVTRGVAVIETEALWMGDLEDRAFCEFFESDECFRDPTNWWAPNAKALIGLCRTAGFRRVEIVSPIAPPRRRKARWKGWTYALGLRDRPARSWQKRGRLVAHAYV